MLLRIATSRVHIGEREGRAGSVFKCVYEPLHRKVQALQHVIGVLEENLTPTPTHTPTYSPTYTHTHRTHYPCRFYHTARECIRKDTHVHIHSRYCTGPDHPCLSPRAAGDFPAWLKAACELAEGSTLPCLDVCLDVRGVLPTADGVKPADHRRLALALHALMCSCHAAVSPTGQEGMRKVSMSVPALDREAKHNGQEGRKQGARRAPRTKLYYIPL